jgi:hypothetical protein
MICYHSLIMRSNTSLDLSRDFNRAVEVVLKTDIV